MRWSKKWFLRTRVLASALAAAAVVLGPSASPTPAQESLDQRYERAMEVFNSAKMEEACELFRGIESQKPGFRETSTYLKIACKEAERIRTLEDSLFKEAVQLFDQGRYEDAQAKFKQAQSIPLKSPPHREQIVKYLNDIDARLGEERLFNEGVKLFNEKNDTEARTRFTRVEKSGGPRAAEARSYLQRIEERREETAFSEGVRLFSSGEMSAARARLQEVVGLNGKRKTEAERYLAQIEQAEREQQAFDTAVRAFEQKRYTDAQRGFQQVTGKNGSRKAEAERYLARIDTAVKEEAAFQEAVRKFEQKEFEGARAGFQQVIKLKGERAGEARTYLTRIDTQGRDPREVAQQFVTEARAALGRQDYQAAVEKLQAATALDSRNREARQLLSQAQESAREQPLRIGLRAYFEGNYDEASRQLGDYLKNSGRKRALATFFQGVTHGARYFLSGERDVRERQLAVESFHTLQTEFATFRPPEKFVSPKILALYAEAGGKADR